MRAVVFRILQKVLDDTAASLRYKRLIYPRSGFLLSYPSLSSEFDHFAAREKLFSSPPAFPIAEASSRERVYRTVAVACNLETVFVFFPSISPRCLFLVRFSFVRASSALFLPFSRLRARLISRPYYQPREEAAPVRDSPRTSRTGA